jgi:hypothetical protein
MKKANNFTFNFDNKTVKKNGRKFGEIIEVNTENILVKMISKNEKTNGEIMEFKILPPDK